MLIHVFTLFPSWFDGVFGDSILARAKDRGHLEIRIHNFRDWTTDKHNSVDDAPYGGGAGMVIRAEPLARALDEIVGPPGSDGRPRVLLTSPSGATFTQARAAALAREEAFAIICGHYEAIDQRLIDTRVNEEVSIGDFVLTGGEIPAMAIVDAVARLIPGVLGNEGSAPNDSFSTGILEGPHYTRPEVFEGIPVPPILLSGHHKNIEAWRLERALEKTRERRPDLLPSEPTTKRNRWE